MSFRQYGGINYASRNNIVKNNYTNANNLSVMTKVGQPNSIINVDSGLYGISGNITFQQNGLVPKYGITFSDGSFQDTAGGGGGGDIYWTNINTNDIRNTNSGNVQILTQLSVGSNTTLSGNLSVSGTTTINNLSSQATTVTSLYASSTLNVTGATTLGGGLNVTSGATSLGGTLGVAGSTSLNGTLGVTGNTILNGTLTVNGTSTALNSIFSVSNTGTGSALVQITKDDMLLSGTYPPQSSNSVVTKEYVDNSVVGYQIKQACQCATTGNITLSGNPVNIDGYTSFSDGVTRILVWKQTNAVNNGIYVVNFSGAWPRSTDLPNGAIATNTFVFVQSGTTYDKTSFLQNTNPTTITVGVDNLNFDIFNQIDFSLGANLDFTGGVLSVDSALTGINSIQFTSNANPQTAPFLTTTVTPGSYTNTNITVNQWGQITSASNGSSGGSSEWILSGSNLYPNSTSYNVLVGTTTNNNNDKLVVQGTSLLSGNTSINGALTVSSDASINTLTIGRGAGSNSSTNTAIGTSTLTLNTLGYNNTAIGYKALINNTEGIWNTAVGHFALNNNVLGNNNTGLGRYTGINTYNGSNNTFLGCGAYSTGDVSNSTAIGYGSTVTGSNQIMMGTSSETVYIPGYLNVTGSSTLSGYVGIGDVSNFMDKLYVSGTIKSTGNVTAPKFIGDCSGNSVTATTATTATTALACSGNSVTATNATYSTTQSLGQGSTAIATTKYVYNSLVQKLQTNLTNYSLTTANMYTNIILEVYSTSATTINLPWNIDPTTVLNGLVLKLRQTKTKQAITFNTGGFGYIINYNGITPQLSITPTTSYNYELIYMISGANGNIGYWFLTNFFG